MKRRVLLLGILFLLSAGFSVATCQEKELESRLESAEGEERVQILNELAGFLLNRNLGKSLTHAKSALSLAEVLGYKTGEMKAINNIGVCYAVAGYSDKALENFQKSLAIGEEIGFENICGMYNNLGAVYLELDDYKNAHLYFGKSLKSAGDGKELVRAHTFANIGEAFFKSGDLDNALKYYKGTLGVYEKAKNKHHLAGVLYSIGSVYFERNDHDNALKFLLKARGINDMIGDHEGHVYSLCGLGDVYLAIEDFPHALKCYNDALENAKALDSKTLVMEAHRCLANAYHTNGENDRAWAHLSRFNELGREVNVQKIREQAAKLRVVFQTEQKQKEIELLRNQNEKQSLLQNSLIIGFCGLLVLFYVFITKYRIKQKTNIELEKQYAAITAKNEELSLLNSQFQEAAKDIQMLSGLLPICSYCKKIRSDEGRWPELEQYIKGHSKAEFSHSICPDCYERVSSNLENPEG